MDNQRSFRGVRLVARALRVPRALRTGLWVRERMKDAVDCAQLHRSTPIRQVRDHCADHDLSGRQPGSLAMSDAALSRIIYLTLMEWLAGGRHRDNSSDQGTTAGMYGILLNRFLVRKGLVFFAISQVAVNNQSVLQVRTWRMTTHSASTSSSLRSSAAPLPVTTRHATRQIIQNQMHCRACRHWGMG